MYGNLESLKGLCGSPLLFAFLLYLYSTGPYYLLPMLLNLRNLHVQGLFPSIGSLPAFGSRMIPAGLGLVIRIR
jgi:hypothetical protein